MSIFNSQLILYTSPYKLINTNRIYFILKFLSYRVWNKLLISYSMKGRKHFTSFTSQKLLKFITILLILCQINSELIMLDHTQFNYGSSDNIHSSPNNIEPHIH